MSACGAGDGATRVTNRHRSDAGLSGIGNAKGQTSAGDGASHSVDNLVVRAVGSAVAGRLLEVEAMSKVCVECGRALPIVGKSRCDHCYAVYVQSHPVDRVRRVTFKPEFVPLILGRHKSATSRWRSLGWVVGEVRARRNGEVLFVYHFEVVREGYGLDEDPS